MAKQLHTHIQVVKSLIGVAEQDSWHVDDATAATQLESAFKSTCDALHALKTPSGVQSAERSGSCALLLALHRARLSVAHVGDCRAVLGKYVDGEGGEGGEGGEAVLQAIQLTADHTPAYQPECERIRACGAYVQESSSHLVVVIGAVVVVVRRLRPGE